MHSLTKKQKEIATFIQEFSSQNQYAPTYREIMHHFGMKSLGSIAKHISLLKKKGVISNEKQKRRSLTVNLKNEKQQNQSEIEIPFIGYIRAGAPIETFAQTQVIALPQFLVHNPEETYALRAQGASLIEEQIANGDLLLIEARQQVEEGETVVALINGHDIIIKRYFEEGEYARLEGNSRNHQPIILRREDIEIHGVLIALLRTY